jgi:uncharacterized repeat protein (TIGR01451 family)
MSKQISVTKASRFLLAASTISSVMMLPMLSALADENSAQANTTIENQATAEFTDAADISTTPTSQKIVSDKVSVKVAEVAGISGTVAVSGTVNRNRAVDFVFLVKNEGNDPTKLFIPGAVSSATYNNGTAIPSAKIEALRVVAYKADASTANPETAIADSSTSTESNIVPAAGANTGAIPGLTSISPASGGSAGGSIAPGGYIKVRVRVLVPADAVTGEEIKITLGNRAAAQNPNTPLVTGGTGGTGNDLYTFDNDDGTYNDTAGNPVNGDSSGRQETSIIATVNVAEPTTVTISGTVYDDKNNSANGTFTNINDNSEVGTDAKFGTTQTAVRAILVNLDTGKVIASQIVNDGTNSTVKGTYSFANVPGYTNVQVILADVDGTPTQVKPTNAPNVPNGWVATSPSLTASFLSDANATKDFGIRQKGKLVLIKRITKVNSTSFSGVVDNPATALDDSTMNWPSGYLKGAVDAGLVKPGDTIEYTVYFLNNQGANASNVKVCDPIRGSQTYVNDSMKLQLGGTGDSANDVGLTDLIDSGSGSGAVDRANSYTAGTVPSGCNADDPAITGTDNGGIAIELTGGATTAQPANTVIPGATAPGTADTYGLFRFTTTVKP